MKDKIINDTINILRCRDCINFETDKNGFYCIAGKEIYIKECDKFEPLKK